jgi:hypothetical protein
VSAGVEIGSVCPTQWLFFSGIFHQDFIVLAFSNCKGALFLGALPSIQLENQNRAIFPFPGMTKIEA